MRRLILIFILTLIPGALAEVSEHSGFPKVLPVDISNAITIADINNDTSPEIIVAPNLRSVYVYSSTGDLLWKAAAGSQSPLVTTSPLVADINGDGLKEIVLSGGSYVSGSTDYINKLYIFNSDGTLLRSYDIGNGYAPSSPAFANGLILVGISGSYTGLYAYDMTGLKWQLPFAGGSERMNSIAVGDLDGDGRSEAVLAGGGRITAVNITASGGNVRWQKNISGAISPVIINVKGKQIVVASGSSGTFAWDASGIEFWNSSVATKYYSDTYASPAVSDINNDGSDDVIIVKDYNLYAISGINGSMLFKVSAVTYPPGSFRARPAVYDINKDSKPEIITGDSNGNLYILDSKGALLDGFPVMITGRVMPLFSSPAVYDLEGDGIPEVAIGSAADLHAVSVKTKNIVVDTQPPVTTDDADGQWHNSSVTITLTAVDSDSGVAATYYTIDGSAPTINSAKGNTITLSEDGMYIIKYFSVDNAGNVEVIKTAINEVKIDKTPPFTTDNADMQWYNSSVSVKLSASDNLAGVQSTSYKVNSDTKSVMESFFAWLYNAIGLAEAASQGDTVYISDEGVFSIQYNSTDNADNIEAEKTSKQVKIDRTIPTITITSPEAKDYLHSENLTLNFEAKDVLSGIDSITAYIDGMPVTNAQVIDLRTLTLGKHILTINAVDRASNSASRSVTFNVEPVPATVDVKPDTLNKASQGAVTVYIEIPGYDVNAIDVNTVTLSTARGNVSAQPSPTAVGDYDNDGIQDRMVKFDGQAVLAIVDAGENVQITINGKIAGAIFEGVDNISVVEQGKK